MSDDSFRERLWPPPGWWLLAGLLALSCGAAVGFYLGPVPGVAVGLLAVAVAVAVLGGAATVIGVEADRLLVGRAVLDLAYVAEVTALDADAARRRSGPDADARAYLVLRPWVATAIEVTLDDPADPTPYWLLSTRRPQRLHTALRRARTSRPDASSAPLG